MFVNEIKLEQLCYKNIINPEFNEINPSEEDLIEFWIYYLMICVMND